MYSPFPKSDYRPDVVIGIRGSGGIGPIKRQSYHLLGNILLPRTILPPLYE